MTWPMRLAFGAVLMFLVTMPWLLVPLTAVNGHDAARMVQLVLMTWCAGMLVLDKGEAFQRFIPRLRALQVVGLFLLGLAAFSVWHAERSMWAFVELTAMLGLLGVAVVIAASSGRARTLLLYAVLVAVGMSAAIEITVAVSVLLAGLELNVWFFGAGYVNHRFMNHTQTVALPLATVALLYQPIRHKGLYHAAWAGVVMGYAVMFYLGGRATWFSLGASLLCVAVVSGQRAWPLLRHAGVCLLMGLIVYAVIFQALPWWLGAGSKVPMSDRFADVGSIQSRLLLWQSAWEAFKAAPWLGVGPMHLAMYHNSPEAAHPHNMYLQLLAEWGLVVAALFALGLAYGLVRLKQQIAKPSGFDHLLLWPGAAVAIDGLFSGVIVMPVSQVWVAMVLGLALARVSPPEGLNKPSTTGSFLWVCWFAACVLLGCLMAVWYVLAPQWLELGKLPEDLLQQFPSERMNPRWWAHGWIK